MDKTVRNENSDEFKVSISEITFSSGVKININEKEKIIIVGSNNSGKSQSLRDIYSVIS